MAESILGNKFSRIALVGDTGGITELINHVAPSQIACIVGASIRPQYLSELGAWADRLKKPLLIQPRAVQPEYAQFVGRVRALNVDLLLCVSYSMLLGPETLEAVNSNAINIHAALLPKNRGANPVQWCLIKGETTTGVTMHYMDGGMDTGDIIAQLSTPINEKDTWITLNTKLDQLTRVLLANELPQVLAGTNARQPQTPAQATTNYRLSKDSPLIDWERLSDRDVFNLVRAQISPLSGAYFIHNGKRVTLDRYISVADVATLRTQYGPDLGINAKIVHTPTITTPKLSGK